MGTSIEYAQLILGIGIIAFAVLCWHLRRAVGMYQHHHDDRAAVTLVMAIGLLVITGGMVISAAGLLLEDVPFSIAGLSITRGAILMVALTLIFADVRRPADE
jgi:hypothetical protein